MNPDRFEELMVKVVDGVASPAEREELMTWIADKPALRKELEAHMALKAVTDGWVTRLEHDLAQDDWESRPGVRAERAVGTTLFVLGVGLLAAWGFVELVIDPTVPPVVRFGSGALVAGALVLLYSVIRWRIATAKSDPYREVIR